MPLTLLCSCCSVFLLLPWWFQCCSKGSKRQFQYHHSWLVSCCISWEAISVDMGPSFWWILFTDQARVWVRLVLSSSVPSSRILSLLIDQFRGISLTKGVKDMSRTLLIMFFSASWLHEQSYHTSICSWCSLVVCLLCDGPVGTCA